VYEDDISETDAEHAAWDIPPLKLDFRGEQGSVEFRSIEELSGAHVKRLRSKAGNASGGGDAANDLYSEALIILITSWDIPTMPRLAIPRGDKRALDSVPGVLLRAMERHVRPYLDALLSEKSAPEGEPGSPPLPASV